HVYVADFGNDRVQIFGSDGSLVSSLGSRGTGDGQFQRPAGVAVAPDGTVFVTDHFNDRIERFGADGHFQAQLGSAPLIVATATGAATTSAPASASSPSSTATATSTSTSTATPILTVTPVASVSPSVAQTSVAPSANLADAQIRRPEGINLDRDGNLWVADYGRDRVLKFSEDGRLLQVVGGRGSG